MLRSSNQSPIDVPNSGSVLRILSVVYDGPVVEGVLMVCRLKMRSKTGSGSSGFRAGLAVPRLSTARVHQSFNVSPTAIGQTCEVGWSQLVDLISGDQIELSMATVGVFIWELDPFGFSLDIR
jgi:hypothetical protein